MGIINWARSRFNGRTDSKRFDLGAASQPERSQVVPEEYHLTDEQQQWHSQQDQAAGFLSIGTLGNVIDEPAKEDHPASTHDDLPEFTIEEAEKLQEALTKLLRRAKSKSGSRNAEDGLSLPLDRFLNCPSSLEVDRRVRRTHDEGDDVEGDNHLSPNTKIILSMAKDLLVNTGNSRGSSVKNKSFKFLLRKMFVCDGGFAPSPSLKDPVESRMDKFFRTVLSKKINGRPSSTAMAKRYYLEDKHNKRSQPRDSSCREVDSEEEDCCRWDRTDSEFIVLEI
ncbi:protein NEGATIVE GRAVITROPIC RESPONSE OF ROOTS-like [Lolium rigidum]|uniref:protein NEGATIVE GRAVITROPIC RESPONSE OF ROOTS-like n=1 Tax=Lolium rigidum TaxID=89674 RepID=UPI001F5D8A05|nr:protein NEGATIVE GRAVITROPIC RESPONSE OF ROOTS-like [Lolium rigidum]